MTYIIQFSRDLYFKNFAGTGSIREMKYFTSCGTQQPFVENEGPFVKYTTLEITTYTILLFPDDKFGPSWRASCCETFLMKIPLPILYAKKSTEHKILCMGAGAHA